MLAPPQSRVLGTSPADSPPGSDSRIEALKNLGGGGSTTIGLNNERFLCARTTDAVLGTAVEAVVAKTVCMIMIPLRNQGSAFAKFCVSSQDSPDKVNFQTLQFASALCQTNLLSAVTRTRIGWRLA